MGPRSPHPLLWHMVQTAAQTPLALLWKRVHTGLFFPPSLPPAPSPAKPLAATGTQETGGAVSLSLRCCHHLWDLLCSHYVSRASQSLIHPSNPGTRHVQQRYIRSMHRQPRYASTWGGMLSLCVVHSTGILLALLDRKQECIAVSHIYCLQLWHVPFQLSDLRTTRPMLYILLSYVLRLYQLFQTTFKPREIRCFILLKKRFESNC